MEKRGADQCRALLQKTLNISAVDHRTRDKVLKILSALKEVKDSYPDTIRILLTGYADMDVAMAAINEGGVYRFITKPWQDEELKLEIRHALVLHDLLKENKLLVQAVRKRDTMLAELEKEHPGISAKRESAGALVIEEEGDGTSLEDLIVKYFPPQKAADRKAAEKS